MAALCGRQTVRGNHGCGNVGSVGIQRARRTTEPYRQMGHCTLMGFSTLLIASWRVKLGNRGKTSSKSRSSKQELDG